LQLLREKTNMGVNGFEKLKEGLATMGLAQSMDDDDLPTNEG